MNKYIKVHGRTTTTGDRINLFWTGSGIEMNVTGSEMWVDFFCDYDEREEWISILVNDSFLARQMLNKGYSKVCVFRGMTHGSIKNVKILKEVQPMLDDASRILQVCDVVTNGEFHPVEDKPLKIEFIGDSLTSGEGIFGSSNEPDWIPMWFSGTNNYTLLTAREVDADIRLVSQSGWGVLAGWNNNRETVIPAIYEKICGAMNEKQAIKYGCDQKYDSSEWQTDFVVINLGTNDTVAFDNPEWIDEKTGISYKLNRDNKDDLNDIKNAIVKFIVTVREYNPNAHIIWAYGMLGYELIDVINMAIDEYSTKYNDTNIEFLKLIEATKETLGSREHPGIKNHILAADTLAKRIKEINNR